MNFGTRQVDLVGGTLLIAMTGATWLFGIAPIVDAEQARGELERELRYCEIESDELSAKRSRVTADLEDAQRELELQRGTLRPSHQYITLRSQLTDLAHGAGLDILSIDRSDDVPGTRFSVVPVQMLLKGGYHDTVTFVESLHLNLQDVCVRTLDVSHSPSGQRDVLLVRVSLLWYVQRSDPSSRSGA